MAPPIPTGRAAALYKARAMNLQHRRRRQRLLEPPA